MQLSKVLSAMVMDMDAVMSLAPSANLHKSPEVIVTLITLTTAAITTVLRHDLVLSLTSLADVGTLQPPVPSVTSARSAAGHMEPPPVPNDPPCIRETVFPLRHRRGNRSNYIPYSTPTPLLVYEPSLPFLKSTLPYLLSSSSSLS